MKIKRELPLWDHCHTSMGVLKERIESYFQAHPELDSRARFYPDIVNPSENTEGAFNDCEVLDVIHFGDSVKKFFHSGLYTKKKLRFWCLSSVFKKINDELYGKNAFNVIAREELFSSSPAKLPKQKPWDLIFAGRLSRQKNILGLLRTVYNLQKLGKPCVLHLFGDFDEQFHEHYGRYQLPVFETEVKTLIEELDWDSKPVIHGHISEGDWREQGFDNPVFISLSTNFCEDFGVAVAEACERGWPLILSDFGAHKDVSSKAQLRIPSGLIPCSHFEKEACAQLSRMCAEFIVKESFMEIEKGIFNSKVISMSLSDVDAARRSLIEKLGSSVHLLMRERLDDFAETSVGRVFIRKILNTLEGDLENVVAIISSKESIKREVLLTFFENHNHNSRLIFIQKEHLKLKDSTHHLLGASNIYLISLLSDEEKNFIESELGLTISRLG